MPLSLTERLAKARFETGRRARNGCTTCRWLDATTQSVRDEVHTWLTSGLSQRELWEILTEDPDNPLQIGYSAFRNHLRGESETCRKYQVHK